MPTTPATRRGADEPNIPLHALYAYTSNCLDVTTISSASSTNEPTSFDEFVRALLDGRNSACVATLGPDGAPQNSVCWIKREGDTVPFSSVGNRQKVRDLRRDPCIGPSVFDLANPHASAEIPELSHKYLGIDPPAERDDEVRVIVRIGPAEGRGLPGLRIQPDCLARGSGLRVRSWTRARDNERRRDQRCVPRRAGTFGIGGTS
ncbi:pyridoxamine 5'-phosphate oxidase family protein [Streptomyces sp. NPDC058964]|uniref:pyridoxamine 5'-phosphate oxidase family protein n=1 Tax=Streptomyces sp. NPDC058964 TaxID=3346681 RepID=UPI0036D08967